MEAYKNNDSFEDEEDILADSRIYKLYSQGRTWLSTFLGVIVTVLSVCLMFVIASIEGTKVVKAKNSDGVKILEIWREEYRGIGEEDKKFPEEREVLIPYNGKEYYFVIEEYDIETKEITKWYFAYDGGFEYIFQDYKFYVLLGFAVVLSVIVAMFNYRSTRRKEMDRRKFRTSLKYYQDKKKLIEDKTQYLPRFCSYKNNQAYENEKMSIIQDAGIDYYKYKKDENYLDKIKLEKWQKKKLKRIRKIRIKGLKPADLLQDHNKKTLFKTVRMLPMSIEEHELRFIISGIAQKILTAMASGFVASFGVVIGEWLLGLTYASMILMAGVSASFIASDFVNTTLRHRYIAKGDYFQEFNNICHIFIKEEEEERLALEREKANLNEIKALKEQEQAQEEVTPNIVDLIKQRVKEIEPEGNTSNLALP